jgi:glycosyltransferase A (GT-A) superfamily protein (DUF2064 family)
MISVIVPVNNQVLQLRRTLRALVPEKHGHEVMVVDGGSRDGSQELARATPWVRLLKQPGSIGAGVNAAAVAAKGDVLLILTPGTVLERGWSEAVEAAAAEEGFSFGAFRAAFDHRGALYRVPEFVALLRTRLYKLPREEQAVFLRRDQMLNGRVYLDLEVARDFNLARRLAREGRFKLLPLSAMRPAPPLGRMPSRCLYKSATFWSFVMGRSVGDLDQCEAAREPLMVMLVVAPEPALLPKWLRDALGDEQAGAVYERFVERIVTLAAGIDPERAYAFYRPARAREEVLSRWGNDIRWLAQSGRGAGERRLRALREAASSSSRPVLLLDPMFPGLTPSILREAIRGMQRCDAVLGPDGRGGCYLVGLRPSHFEGLEQMTWSPDRLEQDLSDALSSMNQTCHRLRPRRALHGPADLAHYWARGWFEA